MIGHQITTTDGRVIFTPWQCEFCEMNTAGEHAYDCPNNPNKDRVKKNSSQIPSKITTTGWNHIK